MEKEIYLSKKFLNWYKEEINNGYKCNIDIEEIKRLIDYIVRWYEIKYPDRDLNKDVIYNSEVVNDLAKYMGIEQLLYRLDSKSVNLLKGVYRAKSGGQYPVYVDGKMVWIPRISVRISYKNDRGYFDIIANPYNGIVRKDEDVLDYSDEGYLLLDRVLEILKDSSTLEYEDLEECIYNHNIDLELRDKILNLVVINIINSSKDIEIGKERAKIFIAEVNDYFKMDINKEDVYKKSNY